ncbi:hypothetical protein SDC9_67379 [bioreactor metagenome]|uniref:Uncharacterized protein n=1 Tax=bioreactor metagenome TaxID=1076179 RepID=A0A644XZ61_9ZZZZ
MQYKRSGDNNQAYQIFGRGKIDLVMEIGLGSTAGEWWHIAEVLSEKYMVLLYGHYIHLTEPDLIRDGLAWIDGCGEFA